MKDLQKKEYKRNYRFYEKRLSNFKTVLKDTNNRLISADGYDYNCMSYAFDIYDEWLELDSFAHSCDLEEDDYVDYDALDKVFFDCCQEIVERFNARRLETECDELKENERLIAFRVGGDDFHFARKNSDGTWTHKPGSNYIREMSIYELKSDMWSEHRDFPYISEVAFFAIKTERN